MLEVFRRAFGVGRPDAGEAAPPLGEMLEDLLVVNAVFNVGTAGVEYDCFGWGVGKPEVVTDLDGSFEGVFAGALIVPDVPGRGDVGEGSLEKVGRVFGRGRAGSGPLGGLTGGRGRADVMESDVDVDIAA